MSKIRFAVIGQGHIGKRHAEMIRRHPEAELVAVCDILEKDKLGLALRFPRFIKFRFDKSFDQSTSIDELKILQKK